MMCCPAFHYRPHGSKDYSLPGYAGYILTAEQGSNENRLIQYQMIPVFCDIPGLARSIIIYPQVKGKKSNFSVPV